MHQLSPNIQVHQAALADLDAIAPLFDAYRQFYGRNSELLAAREFLRERFNHSESVIFLAIESGQALGFTQLYPSFSSVSLARVFVLNDLFVAENARKKGVARQLIQAATHYARTLGAVRVSLSTSISNAAAQATYESLGWKRDEQFFYYHFVV